MKCIYCNIELKLVEHFFKQGGIEGYEKMKEEFKRVLQRDWRDSTDYNCVKCGQVYDETGKLKGFKIAWLQERVNDVVKDVLTRMDKKEDTDKKPKWKKIK